MANYLNLRHIICQGLIFAFFINTIGPSGTVQAQDYALPSPGTMVALSPAFNQPILKGIKVHPDNPFRFDFILDKGESQESSQALKDESSKLIKYFLASLTIPEKDLWVNLSPYEKDRIVPESFGRTEMGRDLLAEDYMLKQITASLIYPEGETGKRFWNRIYEEAAKRFGTTNIPVNTFNKVWIVPEKAVVYENAKVGTAYVVESRLKVMLEQDYLSLQKHEGIQSGPELAKNTNQLGSQIVREIVIPQLTKEVNEDKNFAQLRQVYNSLILATWYKKKIKDSILAQVYENKKKVAGVNIDDPTEIEHIYDRYLQAFKKGAYNYIKEEIDPVTHGTVPRKYFSGGVNLAQLSIPTNKVFQIEKATDRAMIKKTLNRIHAMLLKVSFSAVEASDIVNPKKKFGFIRRPFLSLNQSRQLQQVLSWCRPEDLNGLYIRVIPSWYPGAWFRIPSNDDFLGFQNDNSIYIFSSLRENAFKRFLLHQMVHWILRNRPEVVARIAQGMFDEKGNPVEGKVFPGYYSGVNKKEYAAQIAVYAASHIHNDDVITAEQRSIILNEVFHVAPEKFSIPLESGNMLIDKGLFVNLSFVAHMALISKFFWHTDVPLYRSAQYFAAIMVIRWLVSKINLNLQKVTINAAALKQINIIRNLLAFRAFIKRMRMLLVKIFAGLGTLAALVMIIMALTQGVLTQGKNHQDVQLSFASTGEPLEIRKSPLNPTLKPQPAKQIEITIVTQEEYDEIMRSAEQAPPKPTKDGENTETSQPLPPAHVSSEPLVNINRADPTKKSFKVYTEPYLGQVPYINESKEPLINALAMLYKYDGKSSTVQEVEHQWAGFLKTRSSHEGVLLKQDLIYSMNSWPDLIKEGVLEKEKFYPYQYEGSIHQESFRLLPGWEEKKAKVEEIIEHESNIPIEIVEGDKTRIATPQETREYRQSWFNDIWKIFEDAKETELTAADGTEVPGYRLRTIPSGPGASQKIYAALREGRPIIAYRREETDKLSIIIGYERNFNFFQFIPKGGTVPEKEFIKSMQDGDTTLKYWIGKNILGIQNTVSRQQVEAAGLGWDKVLFELVRHKAGYPIDYYRVALTPDWEKTKDLPENIVYGLKDLNMDSEVYLVNGDERWAFDSMTLDDFKTYARFRNFMQADPIRLDVYQRLQRREKEYYPETFTAISYGNQRLDSIGYQDPDKQPPGHVIYFYLEKSAQVKDAPNRAMNATGKGGIDLVSINEFLVASDNGKTIQFHVDPAMLKQLNNSSGITINSIIIEPMRDLQRWLGINQPAGHATSI
jgi:hypothetical protein